MSNKDRHNYIQEYYHAIVTKKVRVGKWIHLVYTILAEGILSGKYIFDQNKAERAIRFIENFCRHSKGRCDLLKLELWQKACVSAIFGIVDKNGFRQFREVFIVVARKNGKSLFAAAIAAYMSFCDGEYGAEIYCIAPKLEQTKPVYYAFEQIFKNDPDLEELIKPRRYELYIPRSNTTISRLAFNSKKSDGLNPHLVVCDEIAAWPGERGLKQYEVLKSGSGSRKQSLMLSISTAGYEDNGIYDELMKRSTAFLQGGDEARLLPLLYMIDDVEKWDDTEELKKANPNLGVSVDMDFYREEIKIALISASKKAEFIAKYCNIKQNSSVAWLEYKTVDKVSQRVLRLEDFRGCYCVAGIDLSQINDLTAASIVIEKEGVLYVFTQFFMPRDRLKDAVKEHNIPYQQYVDDGTLTLSGDSFVDYHDVYNWILMLVKQYKIRPLKIGYDRYSAQYLIQDLDKAGFHTDDVYQGTNLSPLLKEYEGLLKDRKIELGQNRLQKIHHLNVAVQINVGDNRYRPVKIRPAMKIDGFVSVIDAITVRSKYYAEIGKMLKNEKKGA